MSDTNLRRATVFTTKNDWPWENRGCLEKPRHVLTPAASPNLHNKPPPTTKGGQQSKKHLPINLRKPNTRAEENAETPPRECRNLKLTSGTNLRHTIQKESTTTKCGCDQKRDVQAPPPAGDYLSKRPRLLRRCWKYTTSSLLPCATKAWRVQQWMETPQPRVVTGANKKSTREMAKRATIPRG